MKNIRVEYNVNGEVWRVLDQKKGAVIDAT